MKKFMIKNFVFLASLLMASTNLYAGGLMVTPSRLEFKDKVTSQEVKLINKSNETVTYRVSLQHLRMEENGEYKEIADTETNVPEKFADDLLRFSPRKITLKPNEVQTIRIALAKSDKFENGEYRSHILFREEPSADFKQANNVEAGSKKDDKKISVVLKPLFGISIPVIVTKGNLTVASSIDNLAIKTDDKDKTKKTLSLDLKRTGDASLFGNILVSFKQNKTGKEYDIGSLNAISVFSPYAKRSASIALNLPKDVNLSDGVINVKYVARTDDAQNNKKIFSTASLTVK